MPDRTPRSRYWWMNGQTACICRMTRWPVFWPLTGIPRLLLSLEIWIRKSRAFFESLRFDDGEWSLGVWRCLSMNEKHSQKGEMLMQPISGIHHVTAIASDPQRNLDFYTQVLGLRLVKRTVNFDDPESYHFYFGDGTGTPGTIITFFPWPGVRRGSRGTSQVVAASFAIPYSAMGYWKSRFQDAHIPAEATAPRLGD